MRKLTLLFTNPSRFTMLCIAVVLFAFITRVVKLNFPTDFYFDEVYHGFTATTFLHNDPKGYEYWQSPPEGVAYEWTHPPLAKLFMAGGMKLLGEQSVGWRISSVLFGTGIIALTGVLAHQLFGSKRVTILSMMLLSLDGLHLTMSRIAMNDTHFIFFMLLGVLFYIKWKKTIFDEKVPLKQTLRMIILCSLALGLALSSKWTTLYAGAGLATDMLVALIFYWKFPTKKIVLSGLIALVFIPALYLASYTQFFLQGHTFTQWKETTQQMWWYHTGLVATHSYQSRPWQWILDLKPVWMHVDYSQNETGKLANIYNVGNPLLYWTGLIAVAVITLRIITLVSKATTTFLLSSKAKPPFIPWNLSFAVGMYFLVWVPWIVSPRIMFFYHYAPALPFLSILTAYGFGYIVRTYSKRGPFMVGVCMVLIALSFFALYPINTGLFMPSTYFDTLFKIFPMWK